MSGAPHSQRRRKIRLAVTAVSILVGSANPAPVSAQPHLRIEGDLFYDEDRGIDIDSRPKRLTHGRRITEYRFSPDQRSIVTIENLDGPLLDAPLRKVEPEEVAILAIATGERRVLARSPLSDRDVQLFGMRFSPDGDRLYFHSECAVVTPCVHAVDLTGGSPVLVTGGQILDLIDVGPYRGHLIVEQHRYYALPQGGSFQEAVMVAPDGTEVFDIGSAKDEPLLQRFAQAIRRPPNADGSHPAQTILRPTSPNPVNSDLPASPEVGDGVEEGAPTPK